MDHDLERTILALCNLSEPTTLPDALERLEMFKLHAPKLLSKYRVAEASFEEACCQLERANGMIAAIKDKPPPNGKRKRA